MRTVTEGILRKLKKYALDALFPPRCVQCKELIEDQNRFLCQKCWEMIVLNSAFVCPRCGARNTTPTPCHKDPPFTLAPASYFHEPIPSLIHHYKYKGLTNIERLLSAILITYCAHLSWDISSYCLIPIPLHSSKRRTRGFDHAYDMAHTVSSYFDIECLAHNLIRTRATKPQAQQKGELARMKNVYNCFALKNPKSVAKKNIILLDDVCTSGATLMQAVRVLKSAGATRIVALVVAKA